MYCLVYMKKKNAEVQSRREFFKKAAKTALPILGVVVFGPSVLASCDKDDYSGGGSSSGCKSCKSTCSAHCMSTCKFNAVSSPSYSLCKGTCKGVCYQTCRGTCMSASKGGK